MRIHLKNRDRLLKCNQLALEVYTKKLDFVEGQVTTAIYATIWALLFGGAYVEEKPNDDLTFEEVCDWCDEQIANDGKELIDACNMWTDSFVYQQWITKAREAVGLEKKSH